MKKRLLFFVLSVSLTSLNGQVGIKTSNPHPSSDLELASTNKTLLLNRVPQTSDVLNPVNGMLIYDVANQCVKAYTDGAWSDCFGKSSAPVVVAVCNGFTGTYKSGTALSGATYTVNVTNNSFSTASISFSPSDIAISGMAGVSVASVSPATVNLIAGQSQLITYTLTGTPGTCGTLTGLWTKISLSCSKTVTVAPSPVFTCSGGSWTTPVSPASYKLTGLMNGQSYTGTYSVPYTNGGCTYTAETLTQSGLTLTLTDGNYSTSGSVNYNLSGTYTGTNNGTVTFTTASGCQVYLGPCQSCKEIKDRGLASTDGQYWIDPDQEGSTFNSMLAQCDMTTDGGGWTLVSNYTRTGANGSLTNRTSFPLIVGGLGANETGNTTTWGQANSSLLNAMPFSEIRWRAQGGAYSSSDIFDFKTGLAANISALKGNTSLTKNFTTLPEHNISGYPASWNELVSTPMTLGAANAYLCGNGVKHDRNFRVLADGNGNGTYLGINSSRNASNCAGAVQNHGSSAFIRTYVR